MRILFKHSFWRLLSIFQKVLNNWTFTSTSLVNLISHILQYWSSKSKVNFCILYKKLHVFEAIWFRNFNKVREQEKKIILMRIWYTNAYVFHEASCRECNLWLICRLGAWDMWVHSLILFFHISWVLPFNFQTLPDQQHAYYLRDIGESSLDQTAKMVSRIPFTHPTNVANILNLLRQQLLFNTIISSCIRPYAKQGAYCVLYIL